VLQRLAALIREKVLERVLLDSLDMGKPINDAMTANAPGSPISFSGMPKRSTSFTT
jgi:hypothetical protein